ncbi:MAG: haloacid dehalogenase type II [Verrucomicrobiales bacterium]|nr:haloacid dehalogenase type II [Verrucomicrobiota bacterium JB025]
MQRPKTIIFDVNETLLDLTPLKSSVGKALGGRGDLLPLWFSTMHHYSLVETLTGSYLGFAEIGTAALVMIAEKHGIKLATHDAREAIVPPLLSLPPHPDVADALTQLASHGHQLVSLTNSSAKGSETQLANAGLTDRFAKRYSVEAVRKYKPHPDAYRMVIDDLGANPEEAIMVASHAWDLMGARNAGLQTVFVARPGAPLYPNTGKPDHIVSDLRELAHLIAPIEAS